MVVFTNESHFCLEHHASRIRVWVHRVRIAGTLNSQSYIAEVLESGVHPYIPRLPSAIFQQDNARPHVVRNVQEFFTHQIELLPWPACYPDLSPIENMWSMLARLDRDTPLAATPGQLWQ
ncbi:transposable element Tcb1 transposase [Trichonephila clavipes]|nr:transposable element Tcb1 transposase [Trichonephila clavipes]